ncbi:DAR GTPase 2, mitochondrial [Capsicum baccatum]|uniref:DAR GTPase 2, mitochondrial n=1 Tax=Capsicum baccatum TaxID=33114 RepID=A0A2G2V037_CAPBA|nr:DAR GTPase 2, mitochondrial [Capsicum baccatum]
MTLKHGLVQKIGNAIKEVARNKGSTWWYTPHMAAASRSITERIPLVDILLEVRDARLRAAVSHDNEVFAGAGGGANLSEDAESLRGVSVGTAIRNACIHLGKSHIGSEGERSVPYRCMDTFHVCDAF